MFCSYFVHYLHAFFSFFFFFRVGFVILGFFCLFCFLITLGNHYSERLEKCRHCKVASQVDCG